MAVQILLDTVDASAFASLDRLATKLDMLEAKTKKLGDAFAGQSLKVTQGGGGADPYSKRAAAADGMVGPFRRAAKAQKELNDAIASGDALRIKDAEYHYDRAMKARDRATGKPKSQEEAWMDMIMTSRFGIGAGGKMQLFPLVNRAIAAGFLKGVPGVGAAGGGGGIGGGGISGAAGAAGGLTGGASLVAGVATALGTAFIAAADASAQRMRAYSSAYYGSGGGPNVGKGMAIGGFIGSNAAQDAVSLGQSLQGGGFGASYMRSKGVIDFGYRTVDKMSNLIKALDVLAGIQDENTRIMVARDLGLSDYLRYADASPGARERLKNSFGERSRGDRQINSEFDTLYESAKNFSASMADRFFTGLKAPFAKMSQGDTLGFEQTKMNLFAALSGSPVLGSLPFFNHGGAIDQASGKMDTGKEVVDTLKDIHRTLKEGGEIIGGGKRAHGAIPAAWRFQMADEAIKLQSAHLGSY
jgi:hypothetical protein